MKIILIFFIISTSIYANNKIIDLNGNSFNPNKKTIEKYNPKKTIWIPILETIGFNLTLGSYNKYVSNSDFAQINFNTIKSNFEYGWNWDADNFFTNMWQHPFQGSIYFNTARSNGYSYWTSLLMTSFGSLQWEYFMETEHPSINDFIMTSLQGAIWGEVFYRISSLIIDETSPKKRVWRELGVAGFNPSRELNRLMYKRSFRIINDRVYTEKPYKFNIILGANHYKKNISNNEKNGAFLGLKYLYGDLFKQKRYEPLDTFTLEMKLQFRPKLYFMRFRIFGILLGKSFNLFNVKNKLSSKFIIGIFHYTDYFNNNIFKIGSVSIGPGLSYLSPSFWYNSRIIMNTSIAFMPMGGVNSNYAVNFIPDNFDEGRDYNLSTGLSITGRLFFISKYIVLKFNYSFWAFYTLQGAKGKEFINIFEPSIIAKINKYIKIGIKGFFYYRDGKYPDFPNIYLDDRELIALIYFTF